MVKILLYIFRVSIVVVFCKWCYSYFYTVLSICNHFYTTPKALSFKPYRVYAIPYWYIDSDKTDIQQQLRFCEQTKNLTRTLFKLFCKFLCRFCTKTIWNGQILKFPWGWTLLKQALKSLFHCNFASIWTLNPIYKVCVSPMMSTFVVF